MFCGLDMSYFSLTKCHNMPHFKEETFREVMWPASAGKQQGQDEPKPNGILPLSGFLVASGWWTSRIGVNCESTFCLAESGSTGDGGLTKTACSGPCRWVAQDPLLAAGVRKAVLCSSSQALLLQLRAALHGHVDTVLESSERLVCLLFTPGLLLSSPAFGVEAFWCYLYKGNNTRVTFLLHSLKGDWTITLKIVTFQWELY